MVRSDVEIRVAEKAKEMILESVKDDFYAKMTFAHPEEEKNSNMEIFSCVVIKAGSEDAKKLVAAAEEYELQPDYWLTRKNRRDVLQWDTMDAKEIEKLSVLYKSVIDGVKVIN